MALSQFNHKSSVLCPKTKHITSQYLALEQIEAHHKMVSHARGKVDITAPKSMKSYISDIDRKKKSLWAQKHDLKSLPVTFIKNMDEIQPKHKSLQEEDKGSEDKEVTNASMSLNKSIQAGVPYPAFSSKVADKISWYLEALNQGEFQAQMSSHQNLKNDSIHHYGSQISLSSSLRSNKIVKGDLIEWHKNHFTSLHNSFSPRILVNNYAKSKIREMRCYNPPKKRKSLPSNESSNTFESYDDEEEAAEVEEEEEEKDESTERGKQKEVSITNDETDVSVENASINHESWLNEQAARAQIRHKFGTKVAPLPHPSNMMKSENVLGYNMRHSLTSLQMLSNDEDDKYLKFLSDVTEDILRSGIYSDRAIQQTFEFHLQFCSDNSDKEKLKQLLDQVLESLRVLSDDTEDLFSKRRIPAGIESAVILTPPEKEEMANAITDLKQLKLDNFNSCNYLEHSFHNTVFNTSSDQAYSDPENGVHSGKAVSTKSEYEGS